MPDRTGGQLILAERERQIADEGYEDTWDDSYVLGELTDAAWCYLNRADGSDGSPESVPSQWPWKPETWKPSENNVRNAVRAGALYVAEIDRLRRTGQWLDMVLITAQVCRAERKVNDLIARAKDEQIAPSVAHQTLLEVTDA